MLLRDPFIPDETIQHPDYFVGRKTELSRIVGRFKNPAFESTELIGVRGSGKSSIFRQLIHTDSMQKLGLTIDQGFLGVYLDMRSLRPDTPDDFWVRIVDTASDIIATAEFKREIRRTQRTIFSERDRMNENPSRGVDGLREVLDSMERDRLKLYLLCDNFDSVIQNKTMDVGFFDRLRAQLLGSSFAMVTASSRPLLELTLSEEVKGSPFFNVFELMYVGSFTSEEQTAFIERYQSLSQHQFSSREIEYIKDYGGRFPFTLQLAGHMLIKHDGNIDKVSSDFYMASATFFESIWQSLKTSEQDTTRKLVDSVWTVPSLMENGE